MDTPANRKAADATRSRAALDPVKASDVAGCRVDSSGSASGAPVGTDGVVEEVVGEVVEGGVSPATTSGEVVVVGVVVEVEVEVDEVEVDEVEVEVEVEVDEVEVVVGAGMRSVSVAPIHDRCSVLALH